MNKPYVIIHTHTSIDGNLDIMDPSEFREASPHYQKLALDPGKGAGSYYEIIGLIGSRMAHNGFFC